MKFFFTIFILDLFLVSNAYASSREAAREALWRKFQHGLEGAIVGAELAIIAFIFT